MIVDSPRTVVHLLTDRWKVAIPIAMYIGAVSWLDVLYHLDEAVLPASIVAVPGTVIALLLAFRTNSCYGRWWEARIIWGAIVNDSRTWVRQLDEFCSREQQDTEDTPSVRRMAYRQIAWCYALTHSLRKQNAMEDVEELLDKSEIEQLKSSSNVPNGLLLIQGRALRSLFERSVIDTFQFVELEKTLTRLTNSMGACERIKNTTFPTSYSWMVDMLIYLFIVYLPFGLAAMSPLGLFCTALTLAYAYLVIDRAADYLQDPFENRPSDTPMLSLSRTIEINTKEMLGESNLPEKLQPRNGVLY